MKKKLLCALTVCVLLGGVFLCDQYFYKNSNRKEEIASPKKVREKQDVLNADEVALDNWSEDYLFDIEAFFNGHDDTMPVISLMKEIAMGREIEDNYIYVSKKPIYYWDADYNKVDASRCELVYFDASCTWMEICTLFLSSKGEVIGVDYSQNDFSHSIRAVEDRRLIGITARNENESIKEDMLLDEDSHIVTTNTGYHSFEVTAEGDYFGRIKECKDLVFSYEELKDKDNLIKIELES